MQVTSANSRKQGAMNYSTGSCVILLRDTAAGNCYSQITASPNCQASKARHTEHAPPHLPCTSPLHLRGVTVHLSPRPVVYDWIVTRHANEHTAYACILPPRYLTANLTLMTLVRQRKASSRVGCNDGGYGVL